MCQSRVKIDKIQKYYILKAAPRFELGIEDLQSTALPLGYTAHTRKHFVKHTIINILLIY